MMAKAWLGCDFTAWRRMLRLNAYDVDLAHLPVALLITATALLNSARGAQQQRRHGRRIEATRLDDRPVFIIGHWRSGTTHLHNLLSQDPRFLYPTMRQCITPSSILLPSPIIHGLSRLFLPARRPMDDVAFSPDAPQEDEFALCNMGAPSPYVKVAFPNRPDPCPAALELDGLPPADLALWKATFLRFLKLISVNHPKRLLLKSPTHTCRIPVLLELFPKAVFIHIVRSPFTVIPSTLNLWRKMYPLQGLQTPRFEGLESYVFDQYERCMRRVQATRPQVPAGQFWPVRYEEVVADPLGQLQTLYRQADLGDFAVARAPVERYLASLAGYRPNRWELPPELRDRIAQRCAWVLKEYGYPTPA